MADQNFNVWNSFTQGMGLADNFARMQDEERNRRRMVEQDQAMQQLGQAPQLFGFEDNPKAVRPEWLTNLYQSNPELALRMESQISAPFASERDAKKAGDIERMKREADAAVMMKTAQAMGFMPPDGAGSVLAPSEGQAVPGQGGFLSPLVPEGMAGPGHSGMSRTIKMTPQGPMFEMAQLPPHQIQNDMEQRDAERQRIGLDREQKGINRASATSEMVKRSFDTRLSAGQRVDAIHKEMRDIKKQVDAGEMNPATAEALLAPMRQQLDIARREQTDVTTGLGRSNDSVDDYMNDQKPSADPRLKSSLDGRGSASTGAMKQPTSPKSSQSSTGSSAPEVGAGLPYKQKVEAQKKAMEQKVEVSNKSIGDAQAAADKFNSHLPSINRLFELVSKKEMGNRLGQLPGGETALRIFSQDNDELQKLRNELIDTQKQEGQSQLMNTLPELAIQSDALPSVTNSPDVNRRSMVNLRNLAEARLAAPGFLENWSHQHGGTIDGARQAFREWMQHNPLYKAEEVNGRVTVNEHDGYIPADAWTRLKQRFSTNEIVKKRDAGNIQVINGRVFFKE